MITLGIDLGSRNTKVAIYDSATGQILHSAWRGTDVSPLDTAHALLSDALAATHARPERVAATGYGRKLWPDPHKVLSEISCHAAGVRHFHPHARTVIDIGGQDSKIFTLDAAGKVLDFVMNDKCAAGTGRFLEMTALRLDCTLDQLSQLASLSTAALNISSTCVVFAESEIVGMIAENAAPADIARAVHNSIASRVLTQISALAFEPPMVFTGGVALNNDLVACLARQLQLPVGVPPSPEITGALGAAILAAT